MKALYVYLVCLFIIPFIPNSYSIDVIGVHWFAFSILNVSFILFFLFTQRSFTFSYLINFKPFTLFSFFILFCFLSLFFTRNFNLSIVDFSRVLNVFISIIILCNLLREKVNFYIISSIISFFILLDIFTTFLPFINLAFKSSNTFLTILINNFDPSYLKGFTGNKNINAAFILIKLPFLFYFISNSSNKILKVFQYALLLITLFTILLLKSRAAYLSLFSISFIFIIYSFIYQKKNLLIIPVLFLSFLFSNYITLKSNATSFFSEVSSIQFNDASSQGRLSLWENTFEASVENNFLGLGIGSWKIESLPYWNKNGTDYMVPYHAHNDFFELLPEIGLLGSLSYLLVFLFSFYLIIRSFLKTKSLIDLSILSALIVYFIDANLNFPLERYTMQLAFVILMFLIFNRYGKKVNP